MALTDRHVCYSARGIYLQPQHVILLGDNLDSHLEPCTDHLKVELIRILVQSFLLKRSEGILFLVIVTGEKKTKQKKLLSSFSKFTLPDEMPIPSK